MPEKSWTAEGDYRSCSHGGHRRREVDFAVESLEEGRETDGFRSGEQGGAVVKLAEFRLEEMKFVEGFF